MLKNCQGFPIRDKTRPNSLKWCQLTAKIVFPERHTGRGSSQKTYVLYQIWSVRIDQHNINFRYFEIDHFVIMKNHNIESTI